MKQTILNLYKGKSPHNCITHQTRYKLKPFFIFLMIMLFYSNLQAEDAYIYKNQLYIANSRYVIADLEGQGVTWRWENKSLRFSNSFGLPNDKLEYPKCNDWIIVGPFDLSIAENPVFSFLTKLEYGKNALSVSASKNFTGLVTGSSVIPGDWVEIKAKTDLNPTIGKDTTVRVDLSSMIGNKAVYIGICYTSISTTAVSISKITEMSLTRKVSNGVVESLPTPQLTTAANNIDYFNLSATTTTWSIRSAYAKASTGNDLWLVYRTFDLRSSADAFYSISSQLLNGTNGPVGLKIKITRSKFKAGDLVKDFIWEEYPTSGIDHRMSGEGTGYLSSGKMDLSAFLGGYATIAFQYINAQGEQYQLKDFKVYHIPDTIPPTIRQLAITRVVYNRMELLVNASESASLYWGLYPDSYIGTPTVDQLKSGTGANVFGSKNYTTAFKDSLFVLEGLQAEKNYKLFISLEDLSLNKSTVSVLPVSTPAVDLIPPAIDTLHFTDITNNSLSATLGFSEPCQFYYFMRPSDQGPVTSAYLTQNGKLALFSSSVISKIFGNLQKNVEYSLFIKATDFAGNESEIFENKVSTTNRDMDAPVIQSFNMYGINNTGFTLSVKVSEDSKLYYAVQSLEEVPPAVDGIISGGRAKIFGVENYSQSNNELQFSVSTLKPGKNYVLYSFAADTANNQSFIKRLEFKTLSVQVPVLSKRSGQRIEIGREDTLSINDVLYKVEGYDHPEELNVLIYLGDHYTVYNQSIIAADEFTGSISVPVALGKDSVPYSNTIIFDIIVDSKTVADSLATIRRMMIERNHLTALTDLSTSIALVNMQEDGNFFDAVSSSSPKYKDYMTMVLGGRMINIIKDYYDGRFRRRKEIEVRHKMYIALEYWLDHKPAYFVPESPFLWPEYLGAIMLVLHDDMMKEYEGSAEYRDQIDRLRTKVSDFNDWCWNGVPEKPLFQPFEGNNLSRRLWGTFAIAAALEQPQKAFMVRDTLYNKLNLQYNDSVSQCAGSAPDGSYTMNNANGAQWNWIVYGSDYLNNILDYAEITRRTPWKLSAEKFKILGDVLTDGACWLFWKDFVPYNLLSRYSTRRTKVTVKSSFLDLLNQTRYEALVNNVLLDNNQKMADNFILMDREFNAVDSTKYFWNSNIMVHSRPDFYSSLIMPSVRTGAPEAAPDTLSGLRNYFMGDGTLLTMVDQSSYFYRNVWDFNRLPGLTTEQREFIYPVNYGGLNGKSLNNFAGGVSNGREGIASFYYDRKVNTGNVLGQKSYFFFEKGIVALGTGLKKKVANKQYNVMTTIEQDVLTSDIKYNTGNAQVNTITSSTTSFAESVTATGNVWVYSANKGYVFIPQKQGTKLDIRIQSQTGAWDEINGTWRNHSKEPTWVMPYQTLPVMTLDIDHGKDLDNASYAYMVFPGISEKAFTEMSGKFPYTIIANNDSVQAVSGSSTSFRIVFIKPCSLDLTSTLNIKVDKPAIMMVELKPNGQVEALVSDPLQKATILNVVFTIKEENKTPEYIQRLVSFPQGILKGKAVFTSTGDVWGVIPAQTEKDVIKYVKPAAAKVVDSEKNKTEKGLKSFEFNVYPLPLNADKILNLNYLIDKYGFVEISLINSAGQFVYFNNSKKDAGSYYDQINCKDVCPGIYLLKVRTNDKDGVEKILIK